MIDVDDIRARYRRAVKFLEERGRRLFAANEALASGYGGVTATGAATGLARSTIRRAIVELQGGSNLLGPRVRRPGGGRKRAVALQPGLLAALEALIEDAIRGDPRRRCAGSAAASARSAEPLLSRGFQVSQKLVGLLLRELGYSCQANRKTREGTNHPDRDAQFTHINTTVQTAIAAGEPAISVDTKKKELVGDFKNPGRELRPKGRPEPVRVHASPCPSRARSRLTASTISPPTKAGSISGSMPTRPPSRSRASGAGGHGKRQSMRAWRKALHRAEWQPWFAWHSVKAKDSLVWLQWIEQHHLLQDD